MLNSVKKVFVRRQKVFAGEQGWGNPGKKGIILKYKTLMVGNNYP